MAVSIDGIEIAERRTDYGFRVIGSEDVTEVDSKEDAELATITYPNVEAVESQAFFSPWVRVS